VFSVDVTADVQKFHLVILNLHSSRATVLCLTAKLNLSIHELTSQHHLEKSHFSTTTFTTRFYVESLSVRLEITTNGLRWLTTEVS
jgi:hypothetical protein